MATTRIDLPQDSITEMLDWLCAVPSDNPALRVRVEVQEDGRLHLAQLPTGAGVLSHEIWI